MGTRELGRAARAATAAASLVAAACLRAGDDAAGAPPPAAFVWIDSPETRVDEAAVELRGDAECDGCPPPSGWQMTCPALECPDTSIDIRWTNRTTGATGTATHGIMPACHCSPFLYGYCFSMCDHVWWATVPLDFGENLIEVAASAPGLATGTATAAIERVPKAPAWLARQVTPGVVTLSWTAVEGATSYDLYWSTTMWAYSELCENRIEMASSPFAHTGVASGVSYRYFVTASAGGAESFDSLPLTVTMP